MSVNHPKSTESFFIAEDFKQAFADLTLTDIDAVFAYEGGHDLVKKNIASYRTRLRFEVGNPNRVLFLKRYDQPPVKTQLINWLNGRRRQSCGMMEWNPIEELQRNGIGAPRVVAHGQSWAGLFEKRSFLVTEKIPDAQSLGDRLPNCFYLEDSSHSRHQRRRFIRRLAEFVKRFHGLGFRHRDLYLAHIFQDTADRLFLIDLARAFHPWILKKRFLIKDLAQIYYSMSADHFSRSDRLRFYFRYLDLRTLRKRDKALIRKIVAKANRMARHNVKHGGKVPFLQINQSLSPSQAT
ncbi:MAG: hypothetical protein IH892_00015 [Planctomycetes bacterium]|nr:hypothetical protein [Planctomycetota bacterium]